MNQPTTTTPPVADDIAFVLGLPADRQSAVFAALVRRMTGGQPSAAIPVTDPDGQRFGTFLPDAEVARHRAFLDGLPPHLREKLTRPWPSDFDPDDSFTLEELAAMRAKGRAQLP